MIICDRNFSCCNWQYADCLDDIDEEFRYCDKLLEVEIVRHGKWIFSGQKKTKSGYRFTYHCSRCFRLVRRDLDEAPINEIYPYCHCGAKMDEE